MVEVVSNIKSLTGDVERVERFNNDRILTLISTKTMARVVVDTYACVFTYTHVNLSSNYSLL